MNMPNINKVSVAIRVNAELDRAVLNKFGRPEDTSKGVAYIRALEEATRDVELTAEDYLKIAAVVHLNEQKRKRMKERGGDKSTYRAKALGNDHAHRDDVRHDRRIRRV